MYLENNFVYLPHRLDSTLNPTERKKAFYKLLLFLLKCLAHKFKNKNRSNMNITQYIIGRLRSPIIRRYVKLPHDFNSESEIELNSVNSNPVSKDKDIDKQLRKDRRYENMQLYRSGALKNVFYSYQKLDFIIITLSAGAMVTLLTYSKEIAELKSTSLNVLLFISLVLYGLTIFANAISQVYSYKANGENADWALRQLEIMNKDAKKEYKINECYAKNVDRFNFISILLLFIAISLTAVTVGMFMFWY